VKPFDAMNPSEGHEIESLESFRVRARRWLRENMPRADRPPMLFSASDEEELADVDRNRQLQRLLFDGGFAGLVVPEEYGGQGLTPAHVGVFNEEIAGYSYPFKFQVPTFTPCMAVLLEFGSEEQKLRHVPAMLKGEELWMQFLSEPGGGSDVAGAQTTAVRDGDEWVLNGSKIWTTGAWWSDWALCLARTNWDVPKHRGLSVFMLKIHQPGIEVHRIEMLNGSKEFCQEFLTDVRVPDSDRIGGVDDGWTVGVRWMFHERTFMSSPYTIRPPASGVGVRMWGDMMPLARRAGRGSDPKARELAGEAHALQLAAGQLSRRLPKAMMTGYMTEQAASIGRLFGGQLVRRLMTIAWELAGSSAGVWDDDEEEFGTLGMGYLSRQSGEIAGGTTEMARNVVSERILGMPRELAYDRDVPFRDVPRGPMSGRNDR
jgi:alkylation response protein AidB-like acyl-CoA dehydrogenase